MPGMWGRVSKGITGEGGLLNRLHRGHTPSFVAEFIATMLFQVIGGVSKEGALGNGMALAVLVYMTANISGGHLNPAVSLAMLVTGGIGLKKFGMYCAAQISGAIVGAAITKGIQQLQLHHIGNTDAFFGPGCMVQVNANDAQVFFWELIMTFILVSVIFAVAVDAPPVFAPVAPLAIGFSLYACADAGGAYTGGALNPARFFGPAVVFGCSLNKIHLYWIGEFLGAVLAAATWVILRRREVVKGLTSTDAIEAPPLAADANAAPSAV